MTDELIALLAIQACDGVPTHAGETVTLHYTEAPEDVAAYRRTVDALDRRGLVQPSNVHAKDFRGEPYEVVRVGGLKLLGPNNCTPLLDSIAAFEAAAAELPDTPVVRLASVPSPVEGPHGDRRLVLVVSDHDPGDEQPEDAA